MSGVFELVILALVLYFFFNGRAFTMVDVLSARMQAMYTSWDQGSNTPRTNRVSPTTLRRLGPAERREKFRALSVDDLQQYKDRELFRTKEAPWSIGFPSRPSRPSTGLACKACTPNSKDFSMDCRTNKNMQVQNILKTETEKSDCFLTRTFCHIVHIWRFKKFDFPQVYYNVFSSSILKGAIDETTRDLVQKSIKEGNSQVTNKEELVKQIFKAQEERVKRILIIMRSTLSDVLLRITTWVVYKLFPRFVKSVCLHPSQLEMIQKAAKTNLPLIFVPLHRSHLDYILITFVLQNIRVKSPLVAAGNNLRIPVFGWLLRGLGAFFIKRRIDPADGKKDTIYRAVLHTYMTECLRAGHNIEFYIEGGRTRTGKPCMPKGGLLSVIVGAYMDGTIEDALIVPMSINYDKLVDGNFISELLGHPKKMETFSAALSAVWTTLNSNYGSIRIDFSQPFSLREIVKSLQNRSNRLSQTDIVCGRDSDSVKKNGLQKHFRSMPSTTSLYGTDVVDESHRTLVDKIGRHVIYDSFKACAVMATNSVAFLLLHKFRDGVTLKELVASLDQLRKQLASDNRDVGFTGESENVVEYAIQLLGPDFVKREKRKSVENNSEVIEFIFPVVDLPNVINLSYYSNTVVSHFVNEGVVATAICCSIDCESNKYTVSLDEIIRKSLELCEIFQFEFIFAKPCESLEHVITETVDKLICMNILSTQEIANLEYEDWSQKVARTFDDSEDDEFYQYTPSPSYLISTEKEDEKKLEMFHTILRPLVDAYMATAMCLHILIGREMSEKEFLQEVLAEIRNQLENGTSYYGECSSVDLIRNALKLFKKWGVTELYSQDSVRLVSLTDVYNHEDDLQSIISRIGQFKFLKGSTVNEL
ncbi:hypothetical protein RUM44_001742 [Polyplax serrata]|uniref:Phospholipid/glycerol acyltransferase domain-containing protein n=1 Tax=Polyplax serrata TaxID=468196 RepID=A0ABR1AKZ4_POLSC